ncbi:kynurenine hydrolase-like protein [Grosmannia clavigera kw1407]|uniref:Kynureninase n=1 Tax=Grosmannia clavigera (strain kw1407 / UAMH 11150) TaxID=655863 RepID=F0XA19_GROCL|nr:kynurenine hydrolase-like protein [Grosmannia clavigera kw1407]EFX06100.1 kynurenine hydrolase-like protein [Grosmannia clavigera kw1407]
MDFATPLEAVQTTGKASFPAEANSLEYARRLDSQDVLRDLRDQFIFPTRASLKRVLAPTATLTADDEQSVVYFCGNSLGLQPKAVRTSLEQHLATWAGLGVYGHFHQLPGSGLASWQDLEAACSAMMAPLVGAVPAEVVTMNTLTVNVQLLLGSFYQPTAARHKILLEWKPFPSDYYAISTHIRMRGFDPATSMVELQPDSDATHEGGHYISTASILAAIDRHADDAALLLLPGIQYYSGQLFDIETITRHAHARGLVVGWDLAHAAGNVPLRLHDWDVDFAAWCTYKYINAGPGAIAGAFVHERHGTVERGEDDGFRFRNRLAGWYGADKSIRFNMAKQFQPTVGASGFQLSNPSAIDLASLHGALNALSSATSIEQLRHKSLVLTAYTECLLDRIVADAPAGQPPFVLLTPRVPAERGAQISVLLREGLLEKIGRALEAAGVVCDQRKPNVIRVAPVPMYNSFEDVFRCVGALRKAILEEA